MHPVEEESLLPLLKYDYRENCPGCKASQSKTLYRGVPFRRLFTLWILVLANVLPVSSLFPFLYVMVRDFHIAKREEDISFYAGFIGSAYMFGRMLTSVAWGIFADRYGRKPVILLSTLAVVVFNTIFGLSVNFYMALTSRFLLGCLNGILGPIKAYACEFVREEHHAFGLSMVTTSWGTALIIGPALGGFFAQPAETYPNIFSKDSLFGRFPYFLPCLIISLFAAFVILAFSWIPETLHNHGKEEQTESINKTISDKSIFKNRPLMSSIIVYCVFCLQDMAYTEIFSLWAVSPKALGGLGYTTQKVGEVLTISGLGLLIFQSALYPLAEKLMGTVMICRLGGFLTIPLLASFPYIAKLSGILQAVMINTASTLKNVLSVMTITALFIMQNRSVEQHQRGVANGIAMTGMSLFKAFGPAWGGTMISWSQKRVDSTFLPGVEAVFLILNAVVLVGLLMTFKPFLTPPHM